MARSAANFATASSQREAEDRGEAKGVEGRAWVYQSSPENLEDCRRQWRHGGDDFGSLGAICARVREGKVAAGSGV